MKKKKYQRHVTIIEPEFPRKEYIFEADYEDHYESETQKEIERDILKEIVEEENDK